MQNPIGEMKEKEVELKDIPIYVKVDESTRKIIDKYKTMGKTISNLIKDAVEMYDDYNSILPDVKATIDTYKEQDEKLINFLERAVQYYGQQKNLDRDLWVRARDEMKMMLIGKTTFNQLIAAAEAPGSAPPSAPDTGPGSRASSRPRPRHR